MVIREKNTYLMAKCRLIKTGKLICVVQMIEKVPLPGWQYYDTSQLYQSMLKVN